jgi:putative acetyltransferase
MKLRSFKIREERADDLTAIRDVVMLTFDRNLEADLVNTLREAGTVTLSLVAIAQDETIGHILFSSGTIKSDNISEPAVARGPMAVLPERQHLGGALRS